MRPRRTGFIAVALIAGGLAAAVAGLLVGIPISCCVCAAIYKLAIVTLGFSEIIRVILQNMHKRWRSARLERHARLDESVLDVLVSRPVTVYVVTALVHSTYGRGFIAVRDDEVAASAMGINTTKYKVTRRVRRRRIFAGIAACMDFMRTQNNSSRTGGFGFMQSIAIVVMVILGGMGNTIGVIIAAVLLTLLPEFLRPVAEYRMIIYSLLLIILMLTRGHKDLFSLGK